MSMYIHDVGIKYVVVDHVFSRELSRIMAVISPKIVNNVVVDNRNLVVPDRNAITHPVLCSTVVVLFYAVQWWCCSMQCSSIEQH